MKFVKANLILLVCGTVVLLALVAIYWPLSYVKADVLSEAAERQGVGNNASSYVVPVVIPFAGPAGADGASTDLKFSAPPTPAVLEARQKSQEDLKKQEEQITQLAASDNSRGRVKTEKGVEIPLLNGIPEPYFLPVLNREAGGKPLAFKSDYRRIYGDWIKELAGTDAVLPVVPSQADLAASFDQTMKTSGGANLTAQAAADAREGFMRDALSRRASEIKMYVDDGALQRHGEWADSGNEPTVDQMFGAVVESWLQKDVIEAIVAVNAKSKSVGDSPIKRLERISIGGDAGTSMGIAGGSNNGLFFNPVKVAEGAAPAADAGIDLKRTLTGHIGGGAYDTILMQINIDLDPAAQNRFFDELYKQNNGYTVLNVRMAVVDPFDAAGNGYLYGKTQVVREEILVEALLFRSWTVPLMPPSIRAGGAIGGPSARPAPSGGSGGAPGGGGGGNDHPVDTSL